MGPDSSGPFARKTGGGDRRANRATMRIVFGRRDERPRQQPRAG